MVSVNENCDMNEIKLPLIHILSLPCGTPLVMLDQSEHEPLTFTLCCLFDKSP